MKGVTVSKPIDYGSETVPSPRGLSTGPKEVTWQAAIVRAAEIRRIKRSGLHCVMGVHLVLRAASVGRSNQQR